MLSIEDAQQRILNQLTPVGHETVSLCQAAKRLVAAPITAALALPPFDNSAMDGYAARAADIASACSDVPRRLRVCGELSAGSLPAAALAPGCAVRIFTGAPLPPGADVVVMQEDTHPIGHDFVDVHRSAPAGKHVRRAGDDIAAGAPILRPGDRIAAGEIAMLAAQGLLTLTVFRRPRVAIVATGDELVEVGAPLRPGCIVNSNAVMLAEQIRSCGAEPIRMPIVRDEREAIGRAFAQAAAMADLVITSGGVSVGDFDFVRDVLQAHGNVDFWRVAIKPGKPLAFGVFANTPILGLPGNPVSGFVCFEIFGRPAIRKLAGDPQAIEPLARARLTVSIRRDPTRTMWPRAKIEAVQGGLPLARPLAQQGSGELSSLVGAQALLRIECGDAPAREGAEVEFLPLRA